MTITYRFIFVVLTTILLQGCTLNQSVSTDKSSPITIADQGSFFIGGITKKYGVTANNGDITVNQMYVQYQMPLKSEHFPIVMIHGCCLSSKSWETTPDGRMGWNEYFLRKDRPVYLVDQVSRARSGFDPSIMGAVRAGVLPPGELPGILTFSHQLAWRLFRFGPVYGETFKNVQFPIESVDNLYKQMIPDLNALLDAENPTWMNLALLAKKLDGAILMGHSESGFFPQHAALIDMDNIRGIISIELDCPANLSEVQVDILAKVPTLIIFGDYLGDVPDDPGNWVGALAGCEALAKRINDADGNTQVIHLPQLGIYGNSHMLMQDRNNLDVADIILTWLDETIEKRKVPIINKIK